MSVDSRSIRFGLQTPFRDEARETLTEFVAEAYMVATATDPMLATLLAGMLGERAPCEVRPEWRGDRREGLELCRRLLSYLRHDVADKRLDVSLSYISGELAAGGPSAAYAHYH